MDKRRERLEKAGLLKVWASAWSICNVWCMVSGLVFMLYM
jgi:hypothetical protein